MNSYTVGNRVSARIRRKVEEMSAYVYSVSVREIPALTFSSRSLYKISVCLDCHLTLEVDSVDFIFKGLFVFHRSTPNPSGYPIEANSSKSGKIYVTAPRLEKYDVTPK